MVAPPAARELLGAAAYTVKKMDGKLKDTFNFLPRYRFTILPVPDVVAPIYTSGRGGLDSCLFNTYDLPSRPLYNLTALALKGCNRVSHAAVEELRAKMPRLSEVGLDNATASA